MVTKFEVQYIRSLLSENGDRMITVDQLQMMEKYSCSLTCFWGAENVNFCIRGDNIYPLEGSSSLLGCSESGMMVVVKEYSFNEFVEMLSSTSATELALMNVPLERSIMHTQELSKIFNHSRVISIIDYPKTVTDLEERGWLTTCPSQNILRTDERRFALKPCVKDVCPILKEYIGELYEVDSLGTSFWTELTKGIESLWSSHLKAAPPNHQLSIKE